MPLETQRHWEFTALEFQMSLGTHPAHPHSPHPGVGCGVAWVCCLVVGWRGQRGQQGLVRVEVRWDVVGYGVGEVAGFQWHWAPSFSRTTHKCVHMRIDLKMCSLENCGLFYVCFAVFGNVAAIPYGGIRIW